MRFGLNSYKTALVTLVAITSLVACLGFTVARLFEVERDLRTDGLYTNLWVVTQTQFEAAVLAESLARKAANESFATQEQEPTFRTSILISRLAVLVEGPQSQVFERIGLLGELKQDYLHLTLVESLLQGQIDPQTAMPLRG
ncbi:MAG: hypothetical protein M3O00_19540, partial [Pseudomonadota bacterium]|nr:hypothetical protein [Pseudomonadota bacterium]